MNVTIFSLIDSGINPTKAKNMFDMMARYIQPYHVQVHRHIILKGKATTTTATVRAMHLSSIDYITQERLIYPKRSKLSSWVEWDYIVKAFKIKEMR